MALLATQHPPPVRRCPRILNLRHIHACWLIPLVLADGQIRGIVAFQDSRWFGGGDQVSENMTSGWIGVIRISGSRACALMESESQCRCEGSTGVDPFRRDACGSGPVFHSGPPRAAWPAWRGNRNRRCAAERAAGRHSGAESHVRHPRRDRARGGATVSVWRLSKQVRRGLRGDPSGGPNTPAPAVYSQIH